MIYRRITIALALAATSLVVAGLEAAPASASTTICTWGGTPAAPTGLITFSPGVTNTPSTGPTQFMATGELAGGAGCTGKLTFTGYTDPGNTCALNAPFHAKAMGLPPVNGPRPRLGWQAVSLCCSTTPMGTSWAPNKRSS